MKANEFTQVQEINGDLLKITPLGAGQEVGRSCIIVEYRGKMLMLDCGIHPGLTGMASLPFIDQIDPGEIDLVLITHFHMDHCGSLPWFLSRTKFKGRVFMTHATKAIYRWLLADYIKIMSSSNCELLYDERDLEKSMEIIEPIHFHQEHEASNVRFCCYHAGHVLGAAMFSIDIAGVHILYTGDFSCHEDRHLMAAEIPPVTPDVLIMESTYGVHLHEDQNTREERFTSFIRTTVINEGKCLIPIFSLGRAQELLLIIDEYWKNSPDLQDIKIYYASNLAKKCMNVYQTYINSMNDSIKHQLATRGNPFNFRYIHYLKSLDDFDDSKPCVVLASPGMLQNGISRTLFELWCSDPKNGVMLAGYAVSGTLAKDLASEPDKIISLSGRILSRKCAIGYVSFSAHADYAQALQFVRDVTPKYIVLVHGEKHEMSRMKNGLVRDCLSINLNNDNVLTPPNCTTLNLHFKGDRDVKIVGSLAKRINEENEIGGILVKKGFSYCVVDPSEMSNYIDLGTTSIKERIIVPFKGCFDTLIRNFQLMMGDQSITRCKDTIEMFKGAVLAHLMEDVVIVEWTCDTLTNVYSNTVIAVIVETSRSNQKLNNQIELSETERQNQLKKLLSGFYDTQNIIINNNSIEIMTSDGGLIATVDCNSLHINSSDEKATIKLKSILKYYKFAIDPFCCT